VRKVKPDALIVADPGVFMFVKERAPELPLHISTQANVCAYPSANFLVVTSYNVVSWRRP
jgi:putative protease